MAGMKSKLEERACVEPAEFERTLEMREKTQHRKDYSPSGSIEHFWHGTYFLQHVDDKYRRSYRRKTKDGIVDINGKSVDPITNGHF
jgi:hydroxymethylglutaryl-CoA synthase